MTAKAHAPPTALDAWGDRWEVEVARPTAHGWDVLLGRPPRPRGRGGRRTIVTPELHAYLLTRRYPARGADLPLGLTTIKALRRLLELDWHADHAAWWDERIPDLVSLTIEAFAARHGVRPGAVEVARLRIFGRDLRPAGWWREPADAALLLSDAPRAAIAQELGISVGAVGRLRWMLRRDG